MEMKNGDTFGKLTVVGFAHRKNKKYFWNCKCECGSIKIYEQSSLRSGNTKSCGCSRIKHKNLIGKKFGFLMVLKQNGKNIECKCDRCGSTTVKLTTNVVRGNTTSCGCLRKLDDLRGKTFGYLTVESYAGKRIVGKFTQSIWNCVCKCGNKTITLNNALNRGTTKSCGCLHKEIVKKIKKDITGKKFGLLTVLNFVKSSASGSVWLCQCKCGKICEANGCSLKTGDKKSCGCRQGWWRSPVPGLWKDSAAYAKWQRQDPTKRLRHGVSSSIRTMIKSHGGYKRKKSIMNYLDYTIEELRFHLENQWEPWMNWDNYGGKSNDKRKTWWIDHINPHSSFDYKSMNDPSFKECWKLSNLRPMEKKANIIKGDKLFE
jgi:hypothetical protein